MRVLTQGSVLRPQPWAGESQLLQSCRCLRGVRHGGYKVRVHGCRNCRWGASQHSPTVMRRMTTASPTVQKAACGRKKVRLSPVKKQLLVVGTAPTRSGFFSCPRVDRGVRPIYIIRWSGAVGGISVVVAPHSLMLQGDEVNTKSRDGCCRLRLSGVGANVRRKTSFPPCHRHHPRRHAPHDDSIPHGSKSGLRP